VASRAAADIYDFAEMRQRRTLAHKRRLFDRAGFVNAVIKEFKP